MTNPPKNKTIAPRPRTRYGSKEDQVKARNAYRRERYHADKEYARNCRILSKKYYTSARKETTRDCRIGADARLKESVLVHNIITPLGVIATDVEVVTRKGLAYVIQRDLQTVTGWILQGKWPTPPFKHSNNKGTMFYSAKQVRKYVEVMGKHEEAYSNYSVKHMETMLTLFEIADREEY